MKILIILGYKLLKEGTMSAVLKNRLDKAAALYKLYNYDKIIVTGGNVEKSIVLTESYMMKKYLTSNYKINPKIIIEERISTDTNENAIETCKIISSIKSKNNNYIESVTILSSEFHIERVKLVFIHYFQKKFNLLFESSENGLSDNDRMETCINEKRCIQVFRQSIMNKLI